MTVVSQGPRGVNLQATLSAASAVGPWDNFVLPHHPITCGGQLHYESDGTFRCEHAEAPPDDLRTQYCLDHTVALLLIELSREL